MLALTGHASLITVLILGLTAGSVFAARGGGGGKGGGSTSPSSSLRVVTVTDTNADGLPNHGDQVWFNVVTSNARPVVSLQCSQGGSVVYGDSRPYYTPNMWDDPGIFTLSSLAWSAGAADCRADLKALSANGRVVVLASTTFHVDD